MVEYRYKDWLEPTRIKVFRPHWYETGWQPYLLGIATGLVLAAIAHWTEIG